MTKVKSDGPGTAGMILSTLAFFCSLLVIKVPIAGFVVVGLAAAGIIVSRQSESKDQAWIGTAFGIMALSMLLLMLVVHVAQDI